ncbi:uncharacterized protein C2845_PM06G25400 [Panicum miliaceum]|uniref:Uncharacterized protein n=1 Tax=Panicum miliaceum TaxID=4540 RepID=A0A3L6RBM3_PANMI|nr:uncharacterized protein C2845_PM06G25400 [Panicum miliaceum]
MSTRHDDSHPIRSDGKHEAREVPTSLVGQPALPHLLRLRLRARRLRLLRRSGGAVSVGTVTVTAAAEPRHDERGVAVLAHLGDAAAGPHGPRVHPVERSRRVGALGQHGRPERIQGPDLEREDSAAAGEQAHEHQVLVRPRAVEPPVHVRVQQPAHGIHVAALQRAVQLLHHRLAAHGRLLAVIKAQAGIADEGVALVASQLGGVRRRLWEEKAW